MKMALAEHWSCWYIAHDRFGSCNRVWSCWYIAHDRFSSCNRRHFEMANRRVLSAIFCKILLLTFVLSSFKLRSKYINASYVFCGAKWDQKEFPSRNSSLPRQTLRSRLPSIDHQVVSIIGLTKATLFATQLVLLAGDVSLNPGPMDVCQACNKGCRKNQRAIQCDDCDNWYHVKCINMAEPEFLHLTNPETAWICISCFCPLSSSTTSDLNPEPGNPQTDQEPDIRLRRGFKNCSLKCKPPNL